MGEESEEVGRASIGLPGIGLDLPINRKFLTRLMGWFRRHALDDSVRVVHANMEVSLANPILGILLSISL